MLETLILVELINFESRSGGGEGRLQGWSLAYVQREQGIPKATFYRAVKNLIKLGFIVRESRGFYVLSDGLHIMCSNMSPRLSI